MKKIFPLLFILLLFSSSTYAQLALTDPNIEVAPNADSGNLVNVDTADYGLWGYQTAGWTYNAATDSIDFANNTSDFRGYHAYQLIDASSIDTTGDYTLDISFTANNVSDAGTRTASLIYNVFGINAPGSLTDNSFNGRINSTVDISVAMASAMQTTDISPNADSLLQGYIDLSSASGLSDSESLALSIASDYDSIFVSLGAWGFDVDNVGEALSLTNISISAVPEPSTYAMIFGGLILIVSLRREAQVNEVLIELYLE